MTPTFDILGSGGLVGGEGQPTCPSPKPRLQLSGRASQHLLEGP